jgi:hypothetical protein
MWEQSRISLRCARVFSVSILPILDSDKIGPGIELETATIRVRGWRNCGWRGRNRSADSQ